MHAVIRSTIKLPRARQTNDLPCLHSMEIFLHVMSINYIPANLYVPTNQKEICPNNVAREQREDFPFLHNVRGGFFTRNGVRAA